MTNLSALKTLIAAALLLAAGAGIALFPKAASAADEVRTRAEVEAVIRDYLLKNPEILNEMLAELQKREEAEKAAQAKSGIAENRNALLNDGYSYVAGAPDGDVTIVEFFDYRCAFCKKARPEMLKFLESDKRVRLVLKEFPILSKTSEIAARAAMASMAQGQDKYWAFHLAMLSAEGLDEAMVYDLAAAQGLDVTRLKADMADPVITERLDANHKLGRAIGVDGTPNFVIGDQLIPGAVSAEELRDAVKAARATGG